MGQVLVTAVLESEDIIVPVLSCPWKKKKAMVPVIFFAEDYA